MLNDVGQFGADATKTIKTPAVWKKKKNFLDVVCALLLYILKPQLKHFTLLPSPLFLSEQSLFLLLLGKNVPVLVFYFNVENVFVCMSCARLQNVASIRWKIIQINSLDWSSLSSPSRRIHYSYTCPAFIMLLFLCFLPSVSDFKT